MKKVGERERQLLQHWTGEDGTNPRFWATTDDVTPCMQQGGAAGRVAHVALDSVWRPEIEIPKQPFRSEARIIAGESVPYESIPAERQKADTERFLDPTHPQDKRSSDNDNFFPIVL